MVSYIFIGFRQNNAPYRQVTAKFDPRESGDTGVAYNRTPEVPTGPEPNGFLKDFVYL